MRSLLCVCLVACVVLTAGFAGTANPGQVPDNTLAMMGFSGMQTMTDVQGTEIRGMGGVAAVYGVGTATAPGGAHETTGYYASETKSTGAPVVAAGANAGIAASGIGFSSGKFVVAGSVVIGGSVAFAK